MSLPSASPDQIRRMMAGDSRYESDDAIKTCMKVTTPHGTAYAWDRFRAQMPSSRAVTGCKMTLGMQNAKMLHLAINGGSDVELVPHTLENEEPLLICVWRSRFEELRHIPGYQRHDFVVVADLGNGDDHLHSHAFDGLTDAETAVTPEEEARYSISNHYGYMSSEDEAMYAEQKRWAEEYLAKYGGGGGGGSQ